jgi:hypothetical protein
LIKGPWEIPSLSSDGTKEADQFIKELMAYVKESQEIPSAETFGVIKKLSLGRIRPSIEDPPDLELKELPEHLEYEFLIEGNKLPVTIIKDLAKEQELLVKTLMKRAIA